MLADVLIGAALALATTLPLALKWQLGAARAALAVALLAAAFGLVLWAADPGLLSVPIEIWLLTVLACALLTAQRFYRDPERSPPDDDSAVVSPADGEVLYVRRSHGGHVPAADKKGRSYSLEELTKTPLASAEAVVVGIALSFLDVHVNRAPITGTITTLRRHPGGFASLRRPEAVLENERATLVMQYDHLQVAIVLIASRLVRRISLTVKSGDQLSRGDRIGMIRFGSQVDLVLPAGDVRELRVKPGDRVVAGETVVARI